MAPSKLGTFLNFPDADIRGVKNGSVNTGRLFVTYPKQDCEALVRNADLTKPLAQLPRTQLRGNGEAVGQHCVRRIPTALLKWRMVPSIRRATARRKQVSSTLSGHPSWLLLLPHHNIRVHSGSPPGRQDAGEEHGQCKQRRRSFSSVLKVQCATSTAGRPGRGIAGSIDASCADRPARMSVSVRAFAVLRSRCGDDSRPLGPEIGCRVITT